METNRYSSLFQSFSNLLTDVAKRFVKRDLGDQAFVHGSAATGSVSFLSFGDGVYLVSDIDIIVNESMEVTNCSKFEAELFFLPQWHLKAHWSPAVKVSIKHLNDEFRESIEGTSLIESLFSTGVPIVKFANGSQSYLNGARKEICFPYALPYAIYRWLSWAGNGPESNAAALYELAKGCLRTIKQTEKSISCKPKVLFESHLRKIVCQYIISLSYPIVGTHNKILLSWAKNQHTSKPSLCEREIIYEELQSFVKINLSNSILNKKLNSLQMEEIISEYRS